MTPVHVHFKNPARWQTRDGTHVWGGAFRMDQPDALVSLPDVFGRVASSAELRAALQRLNGSYAVIREADGRVFAAVDRNRSYPLFYACVPDGVHVSDDGEWVRAQVGDGEYDDLAKTEYLLTGYVTGSDTLYPHVKQLQAGEAVWVDCRERPSVAITERYYRRLFGNPFDADGVELRRMHEAVLERSIRRLIARADGRWIVIPLSGGFDSRLIALMLKRLRYERVMAFSYGKPGNADSRGSQRVARTLGIPWHFVPYSTAAWYQWFHSPERRDYYRYAGHLASLAHLQDWPAVWELKKAGVIPDAAVFTPGHAGTRLRSRYLKLPPGRSGEEQLVREIWRLHYKLSPWNPERGDLGRRLWARVVGRAEAGEIDSFDELERAVEKWIWQERNSKLIANAVRVYEFWGYDWWLPLLDAELLDFWSRVPVEFRSYKKGRELLYEAHAAELYARWPGATNIETTRHWFWPIIKWVLRHGFHGHPVYRAVRAAVGRYVEYDTNSLAYYGIMNRRKFRKLYRGRNDFWYFLAQEALGYVSYGPDDERPARATGVPQ